MRHDLIVSKSVIIDASAAKVQHALTEPEIIKLYLYGTNTITDWKVGSEIIFEGEYEGQKYRDRGVILEFIPEQKLSYLYWSGFSGLEDLPENYSTVTGSVKSIDDTTSKLTCNMKGFANEDDGYNHSVDGMDAFLQQLKNIVEG